MTKIEFDNQVREMRDQKLQIMEHFLLMNNELKEEIANKKRQMHELGLQLNKLKMQKHSLVECQTKASREWSNKIQKFISDFHKDYETSWQSVSTYTLVKELRKRGWHGKIENDDPEMSQEHKNGVIAAFNGIPYHNEESSSETNTAE